MCIPWCSWIPAAPRRKRSRAHRRVDAQSVLARERIFEHFSRRHETPVTLLRLNYAIDLRYGVLLDVGTKVFEGRSVDVTMGAVNVIWQGDANSVALRSLGHGQSPPFILNLTGAETLSIRTLAHRFGEIFGRAPIMEGQRPQRLCLIMPAVVTAYLARLR